MTGARVYTFLFSHTFRLFFCQGPDSPLVTEDLLRKDPEEVRREELFGRTCLWGRREVLNFIVTWISLLMVLVFVPLECRLVIRFLGVSMRGEESMN